MIFCACHKILESDKIVTRINTVNLGDMRVCGLMYKSVTLGDEIV